MVQAEFASHVCKVSHVCLQPRLSALTGVIHRCDIDKGEITVRTNGTHYNLLRRNICKSKYVRQSPMMSLIIGQKTFGFEVENVKLDPDALSALVSSSFPPAADILAL